MIQVLPRLTEKVEGIACHFGPAVQQIEPEFVCLFGGVLRQALYSSPAGYPASRRIGAALGQQGAPIHGSDDPYSGF